MLQVLDLTTICVCLEFTLYCKSVDSIVYSRKIITRASVKLAMRKYVFDI